ncbi:MAG: DHA2 family efflux MFS transporter permease subunit [Janthinobacterium lividum]
MKIALRSPSTQPLRPYLILGICCLSLLMVSMDATIVNVALPAIRVDLGASISGLQWVIDSYTMVVASLLMLGGSTADRFGRRRIFQTGMALFMAGSLLCSLAGGIHSLIFFRVVQALGATMLNPVAMSIITNIFHDPKARARAIGVWGAVVGVSMALGPLVGGALTQSVGWRAIFWINLPIGLIAIVMAALYIPESKSAQPRRLDPVGQLLVFAGLVSVTYAVIEGPHDGWHSPLIVGLFAVALGAVAGLALYEPRRVDPLLDPRFFRSVPFTSATLMAFVGFAGFSAFLFLNALYLQEVRGLSAFDAGLCTLPFALATIVCSPVSGRLVAKYGTRPSLMISACATTLSAVLLTQLTASTPIAWLMCVYVIYGIGFGLVNPPITNTAVSGMPRAQAGLAAAVASTSRQMGASMGVAIAGTVVGISTRAGISFPSATHAVWWLVAGCGAAVFVLGWLSNTPWAERSTRHAAHLLEEEMAERRGVAGA